jgi:dTDP-glucose 4,6-dehydratase
VGEKEIDNLSLAQFIVNVVGKRLKYEMTDWHSQRPGHDLRYSLDGSKLREMGLEYPTNFEESLTNVIKWSLENRMWIK